MNAQTKRVNREEVLEHIKDIITHSANNETELSPTELAKSFGVTQPTMDYHIKNLVKNGELIQTSKIGKYNRKVYRLPKSLAGTSMAAPLVSLDASVMEKLIMAKNEALKKQESVQAVGRVVRADAPKTEIIVPKVETPALVPALDDDLLDEAEEIRNTSVKPTIVPEDVTEKPVAKEPDIDIVVTFPEEEKSYAVEVKSIQQEMEQREKSLDEKIDDFLMRSKAIPAPQDILKKDDREILAVMNETIHQTMAYMRNLEDQLSTVENKQMIMQLVDDRNRILKELEEQKAKNKDLMLDVQILRTEQKEKEASLDPGRIRNMQQMILATLDNHVEQPNHAMALGKHEFRKNMTKEINDLVRYVLGLEK